MLSFDLHDSLRYVEYSVAIPMIIASSGLIAGVSALQIVINGIILSSREFY